MGNDGGSIPTRRELVKNAARNPNTTEVKATQLESQTHAWAYCPLSQRRLATPIVSDCAGILYNKDAVLEHLLPNPDPADLAGKKTDYDILISERIKSLRDVVEVKFHTEKDPVTKGERLLCPITSKALGTGTKAVYIVPCGHAFSDAAVKEVAGDLCLSCNEPYESGNIIPILSLAKEDVQKLELRVKKLKASGLTHSLKKAPGSKKRKKHAEVEAEAEAPEISATTTTSAETPKDTETKSIKSRNRAPALTEPQNRAKPTTATASIGIKNAATASLTAKVLEEHGVRNKKQKLGLNDNLKSLFSSGDKHTDNNFMTRGYSIPKRV